MGLCSCGAGLKEMNFKTTIKGAARIGQIAMGDLWVHVLSFILLVVSLGVGVHKLINGPTVITTLAISVVWIVYALIPPFLLIWYTFIGRSGTLRFWCRCVPFPFLPPMHSPLHILLSGFLPCDFPPLSACHTWPCDHFS
jgi:hypothetical protein